jgi:hypothetical protein
MKHGHFHFWPPFAMIAFIAVFSFAVMLLWNWLLPSVAGLPEITFLQALGLLALSRILFGGLGGMGRRIFAGGGIRGGDRGHINPFREKWEKMNDEERREFLRKHNPLYSHIFGGSHEDEPFRGAHPDDGFHPGKDKD